MWKECMDMRNSIYSRVFNNYLCVWAYNIFQYYNRRYYLYTFESSTRNNLFDFAFSTSNAKCIWEQDHELLACPGGWFIRAKLNWSIVENETYADVQGCQDFEYLLQRAKGCRIYSDHANLIQIFILGNEIKKHIRGKLQKWVLKFGSFNNIIKHISNEINAWVDVVSRWSHRELTKDVVKVVGTVIELTSQ